MRKIICAVLMLLSCSLFAGQFKHNFAWDWSVPHDAKFFDALKQFGFNVYVGMETGAELEKIYSEAGKRDIEVYRVMEFKANDFPECDQVISDSDIKKVMVKSKKGKAYKDQVGGEPVEKDDIFKNDMMCFNREEALKMAKAKVSELAADKRAAGVCFDWFGYRNYLACYCDICLEKEAAFAKAHPELSPEQAQAEFSEDSLVNFMNAVIAEGRRVNPAVKFTCHVYPYFKPNPLYGNKLNMEYPEQTVSWFFLPHWDLAKVREYTRVVVKDAKKYYKDGTGIPFLGIYADENKKSASRLAEELKILREEGAEGVSVASFGEILKDPEMVKVFQENLK